MNKYHCCAACIHYGVSKNESGVSYRCIRLGFKTKPEYRFNCWVPKDQVKKLMERRK